MLSRPSNVIGLVHTDIDLMREISQVIFLIVLQTHRSENLVLQVLDYSTRPPLTSGSSGGLTFLCCCYLYPYIFKSLLCGQRQILVWNWPQKDSHLPDN